MSINAIKLTLTPPPVVYQPRSTGQTTSSYLGNVIPFPKNYASDINKTISTNISLKASLERTLLEKQYWDKLMEKLRKGGGGGGGSDPKFDRVAVSMMLMSFISSKVIKAFFAHSNAESLNKGFQSTNQTNQASIQGSFVGGVSRLVISLAGLLSGKDVPPGRLHKAMQNVQKMLTNILSQAGSMLATLSAQLNKLKEIIENELKEFFRKINLKEKMRKIKTAINDFFVEMKEMIIDIVSYVKYFLPSIKTGNPRMTQ